MTPDAFWLGLGTLITTGIAAGVTLWLAIRNEVTQPKPQWSFGWLWQPDFGMVGTVRLTVVVRNVGSGNAFAVKFANSSGRFSARENFFPVPRIDSGETYEFDIQYEARGGSELDPSTGKYIDRRAILEPTGDLTITWTHPPSAKGRSRIIPIPKNPTSRPHDPV